MTVQAPAPFETRRFFGERVKRREDPRMLAGASQYVGDIQLPGAVEAAFVRSPHPHAEIRAIDVAAARQAPGVLAVLTHAELAEPLAPATKGIQPLADMLELEGIVHTPRPALPSDRVRYVGEPVAVVIARDRYLAEDACELVSVDYDPLPAVADVDAAMDGGHDLHEHVRGNVYFRTTRRTARTDEAFRQADRTFRRRLHINRHLAAPMEARAILARYDQALGELTCWLSSQAPHPQRYLLSKALGLPENRIRVIAPDTGGSFGPKDFIFAEDLCVVHAARLLGVPVRWLEDRHEHLLAAPHAKEQEIEVELAFDAENRLTAMRGRFASDTGAFCYSAPGGLIDAMFSAQSLPGVYDVREYDYQVLGVLTNKTPVAPYRGVGCTAAHTIREVIFDEAARELGIDRMELRRRNLIGPDPYTSCTGQEYDGGSYREAFDLALDKIGYAEFEARQAQARREGRYIGLGAAPFIEMTAMGALSGTQTGIVMPSHDNAQVTIDLSGKVTVGVGTYSHGQGHHTTYAQIAAESLGVDVEDVVVIDGDTSRAPWGMGTYASRSAVFGGGAVMRAAAQVRERVLEVASLLLEADTADLELVAGHVGVRGAPSARIPLADLAGAAHFDPGVRAATGGSGLTATIFHDSAPAFSNGAVAVIAEVDPETGQVRLDRIVAVEDCGVMINPMIVEGQIRGGFAQGVGAALLESFRYDDSGQPLTTTYLDYFLPRASDLTRIEIEHLCTPSPRTFGGMKGMAEGMAIGAPAAVINAVMDALSPFGARVDTLPLNPAAVVRAMSSHVELRLEKESHG
jgi:aerobic carbon-monoxide dehydrogenase large subunit